MSIIDLIFGHGYWSRCRHRSHVLHLRCLRGMNYDSYCPKHNWQCWGYCGEDRR